MLRSKIFPTLHQSLKELHGVQVHDFFIYAFSHQLNHSVIFAHFTEVEMQITISKLDGNQVNTRIAKCDAKLTILFS